MYILLPALVSQPIDKEDYFSYDGGCKCTYVCPYVISAYETGT